MPQSSLPCGNIDPLGITGTPVYDPATGLVFAVAEVTGPAHILVGLNVTTGATVIAKPSITTTYTATNSGNCSATVTVTVNPQPKANFTQGACSGGAILLTRTGTPTTGVTFKWLRNGTVISGATNKTYSATITADYKVRVTITAAGCSKTSKAQTVTITCKVADATAPGMCLASRVS